MRIAPAEVVKSATLEVGKPIEAGRREINDSPLTHRDGTGS